MDMDRMEKMHNGMLVALGDACRIPGTEHCAIPLEEFRYALAALVGFVCANAEATPERIAADLAESIEDAVREARAMGACEFGRMLPAPPENSPN